MALAGMRDRDVTSLVRRGRERHTDQIAGHGIERGGLGIDRNKASLFRLRDPDIEQFQIRDRLVARAVALARLRFLRACRGQRGGGRHPLRGRCGREPGVGSGFVVLGPAWAGCVGNDRLCPGATRCEAGIRHDLFRIRLAGFGHPLRQRVELHRLQKGDQLLRVDRMIDDEVVELELHGSLVVEQHKPLGYACLLGELDQRLPPLVLLDLARALEKRFEVAVLVDKLRGGLHPDAGNSRHVVGRVARERLHLGYFFRRYAELFLDFLRSDPSLAARHRIVHFHAGPDQLHKILVAGNDRHVRVRRKCRACVGRDQVVRLVVRKFDRHEAERLDRLAHQRELRDQVVGRVVAVGFVFRIDLVAKTVARCVEHNRDMRRLHAVDPLAHELPQHVAERHHRADRQAVGAGERAAARLCGFEHREIGAEDVRGAVDQEHVVACFRRLRGLRCALVRLFGCCLRHGASGPRCPKARRNYKPELPPQL